ncbi:hypothetical protein WI0192307A01_CDS0041 [Salmonella phage VT223]
MDKFTETVTGWLLAAALAGGGTPIYLTNHQSGFIRSDKSEIYITKIVA